MHRTNSALPTVSHVKVIESVGRRSIGRIATLGTFAVVAATATSFSGRVWWIFDLLSHFRAQFFWIALLLAGLLFVVRRRRIAMIALVLLSVNGGPLRPFCVGNANDPRNAPTVRVMTLNVWARNREYERVISYLREASPDIVVLVEVDGHWRAPLEALASEWPHRRMILNGGHLGIAILSRMPLDESGIEFLSDGIPIVVARATINGTPVAIFGVHLDRPMSASGVKHQARQLAELVERLHREPPTRLVLGDFNATSWSDGFSDFVLQAGLRDSRNGFGIQPSWPSYLPAAFRIPIDHCLVTTDVEVTGRAIGPNVGSDHLPVIVDLKAPVRLHDQAD